MESRKDLLKELRIDRETRARQGPGGWLWIAVVLLSLLGVVGGWWWFGSVRAATVRTASVREATGHRPSAVLNASGYVTARRQATVSSKVTGKIVEVLVEEGLKVHQGQVLARLDDSTIVATLKLARAELAAARQSLAETEVRWREAGENLERTRGLYGAGISTKAALDADQAEFDSLQARVALGQEQVAVANSQVGVLSQQLDDLIIRAPFDGIVVSKNAQPGEMISPISAGGGFTRTGICTVVDMNSLEVEVDVNESYIARVEPGQRVEAVLDAYPEWRIPAHVITPVPTADRQKATVRVRIAFDKLDPRILPDMGVKVTFLDTGDAQQVAGPPRLLIPRAAVRRENDRDVVYVLVRDRVERRGVSLGVLEGTDVVVTAGLSTGEQVVVEGPLDLADGDRVIPQGS